MKKNYLIFLFLVSFVAKSNSVKLNIYLNFNECVNCFISLNFVNQLNKDVDVCFFIEEADSSVSAEFLQPYNFDKRIKFMYEKNMNPSLLCKLFLDDSLLEEFHLKELPKKINKINLAAETLDPEPTHVIKIPKKLNIKNDRAEILISKTFINVYDYILNKTITFKIDHDSLKIIKEISGRDFIPELFLQLKTDIDTALYRKSKKTLVMLNKQIPHIERAYINDSSLFLLINFSALEKEGKDTAIVMKFFQYEYNLITKEKNLSFIHDDAFSAANKNEVFINNALPFYYHNATFWYPLFYTTKKKDSIPLVSGWRKSSKTQIYFNKKYNFKLSKTEWNTSGIDSNLSMINNQFYFFALHGILYDYKNEHTYKLNIDGFSPDLFVSDVCKVNNEFKLITFINDKPALLRYDHNKKSVVNSSSPDLPKDYSENTLKFYTPEILFSINKSNTCIYLTPIGRKAE